jgi:TPR repeat protein
VEKDPAEAVKWYRKAAIQGDATAQYALGCALEEGDGVEKDVKAAEEWFAKAAAQGIKKVDFF